MTKKFYCPRHWTTAQRLAHYIKVDPLSGCHLWQGSINRFGYGQLSFRGKPAGTHRLAWIVRHGPIPEGLYVCHRCDERRCCNPDHMFLGTHEENMADMKAKNLGRWRIAMERLPTDRSATDIAPIEICIGGARFVGHARVRPFQPHRKQASGSRQESVSRRSPASSAGRPIRRRRSG